MREKDAKKGKKARTAVRAAAAAADACSTTDPVGGDAEMVNVVTPASLRHRRAGARLRP
ncbi:hypothetical protein WBG06_12675 [Nocardioides sp. CCNWLW239]|uniref:hypothetical protein n=1 Tax=Nocardioides sp. CCNWLW239 TaxID=3128902 RepID=UPI003019C92E